MDRKTFACFVSALVIMLVGTVIFCNQIAALNPERNVLRILNDTDELVYYTVYWLDHPYGVWMDPYTGALRSDYAIAGGELRPGRTHDIKKFAKGKHLRVKFWWRNADKPDKLHEFIFSEEYCRAIVTPEAVVLEE